LLRWGRCRLRRPGGSAFLDGGLLLRRGGFVCREFPVCRGDSEYFLAARTANFLAGRRRLGQGERLVAFGTREFGRHVGLRKRFHDSMGTGLALVLCTSFFRLSPDADARVLAENANVEAALRFPPHVSRRSLQQAKI